MGMPITIHIEDCDDTHIFNDVFNYLKDIDQVFSTYKKNSLISKIKLINQQLKTVIALLSKIDKGLYVIVPKSASIMASAISEVK
jgi:hypothetical protein